MKLWRHGTRAIILQLKIVQLNPFPRQSRRINMSNIIHLLSGGLDSVTLLYDLKGQGHDIHCVLFDYGQAHVQELNWAKHHCNRLSTLFTTITLPQLGGLTNESWIVPFRNPIMLSIAVNLAIQSDSKEITIGCNADDNRDFPDCRWEVFDALNHAIKLSGYDIEIKAPYLDWPKWKIGGLAREMGVQLYETWSCYKGGSTPCGDCPACNKISAATNM